MTGEELKKYKQIYTDITVPKHIIEQKWAVQRNFLPHQEVRKSYYSFMQYGAVFASVFFLVLVVAVGFVQAAKPGSLLYPVKALTKQVSTNVANTFKTGLPNFVPSSLPQSEKILQQKLTPTPTAIPTPGSSERSESGKASENAADTKHPQEVITGELKNINEKSNTSGNNTSGDNSLNSNIQLRSEDTKSVQGAHTENNHASNSNNKENNGKNNGKDE